MTTLRDIHLPDPIDPIVLFIAQDKNDSTSLIFGVSLAIFTCSRLDRSPTQLIAGNWSQSGYREGTGKNALFNRVLGFAQTSSGYIVSDANNHCLRLINLTTQSNGERIWQTSMFAGKCETSGLENGPRLDARFNDPRGLVERNNMLYIVDSHHNIVRKLDLSTGEITSLTQKLQYYKLKQLVLDDSERDFYVTTRSRTVLHVEEFKIRQKIGTEEMVAEGQQQKTADFNEAIFNHVTVIAKLSDKLLLVTDQHAIKLLDLESKQVQLICTGLKGDQPGNIESCQLDNARSLAVLDDVVYIGDYGSIKALPYTLLPTTQFKSQDVLSTPTTQNGAPTTNATLVAVMVLAPVLVIILIALVLVVVKHIRHSRRNPEQGTNVNNSDVTPEQMKQMAHSGPLPIPPMITVEGVYGSIKDMSAYYCELYDIGSTADSVSYIGPVDPKE